MMVPSFGSPETASGIWPYDVKVENNSTREEKGSPKLNTGSTII